MITINNRKGELTSKQIVTIVILIISFVIIVAFFVIANFGGEVDSQACRNSVVLRNLPFGDNVQLNCKTKPVCISSGGECSRTSSKDLEKIEVESKSEILNEMADLMYNCWWQYGEGKVDFAEKGFKANYCGVCNIVYFDEKTQQNEDTKEIKLTELFVLLQNKKVPKGDISYLYSMYGVTTLNPEMVQHLNGNSDVKGATSLDTSNPYALVIVLNKGAKPVYTIGGFLAGVGAGAGIGALIGTSGTPVGTIAGAVIGGVVGGVTTFVVTNDVNYALPPQYIPYDADELKKLDCKQFSSLAG